MAVLEILTYPDKVLRKVARPVESVDDDTRRLVDDMFETMYEAPGIGLAATQVGVEQRIAVVDVSEAKNEPLCLINPEITSREGVEEMEEGCLSLPEVHGLVSRAARITFHALDQEGQPYEMEAEGLLAVCVQHEIDHLDGKLFIDYLSPLKRERAKKKLIKLKKRQVRG